MFCPSGHCLCRTIQSESTRIWNDLQDAETLNSPIHEDTVTQTFALTLNRQHGGQNRVHIFGRAEEAKNGSDFLWLFFSADGTRHFRVAVQAKRLYPDGTYNAFKVSQAKSVTSFASSIAAFPIYIFYNSIRFPRRNYSSRSMFRRHFPLHSFETDPARDIGAIYVPAGALRDLSVRKLTPKHIARKFIPLWHPFCNCDFPIPTSPLDDLAERFTYWGETLDRDVPGCRDTDQVLRRWMAGERMTDGQLEDALRVGTEASLDGFLPSFVVGTRLRNRGPSK